MSSYEDYVKRVVPLIIEKSDDLRRSSDLDDTQKKLYGLILEVFSFSANTVNKVNEVNKLDKQTNADMKRIADMEQILEDIQDQIKQFGKIDPNL